MENKDKPDIDKGYAWVILAGCYVMYLVVSGPSKSYGILFTEIDEQYDVGSGPVSIIGSVHFFLMFSGGPFANYLAVRTSFRKVALMGGVLLCLGYSSSLFIVKLEFLFLTLGVLAGLGSSLSFTPCSTIISFYFEKRRALANGIIVSAGGIGSMGFSFLYKYLIDTYAIKPSFLIIGGILLNVCVAACCFRQPESLMILENTSHPKRKEKSQCTEELLNRGREEKQKQKACTFMPDLKISLFKNPRFTLYLMAFMIGVGGYGNYLILIPSEIRALGFDKNCVSIAIAVTGAAELVARIAVGWLADKKWIHAKYIFTICFAVSAVFTFVTPHIRNLYYMYAYSAVIGIFPASFWSLVSVLVIDVVGMKDFPPAYGLVLPGIAVGVSVSQASIAWIKDITGTWEVSYYVTGMLFLLPAIMMLVEPLIIPDKKIPERVKVKNTGNSSQTMPAGKTSREETKCLLMEPRGEEIILYKQNTNCKANCKDISQKDILQSVAVPIVTQESL